MVYLFQAQQLNKDIFETIYYHSLKASAELAAKEGPYETYEGSPVSKVFLDNLSPFQLLICLVFSDIYIHDEEFCFFIINKYASTLCSLPAL